MPDGVDGDAFVLGLIVGAMRLGANALEDAELAESVRTCAACFASVETYEPRSLLLLQQPLAQQ